MANIKKPSTKVKTIKVDVLIDEYTADRMEAIKRMNQNQYDLEGNQRVLNSVQQNIFTLNQSVAMEQKEIVYINGKLEALGVDLTTLPSTPVPESPTPEEMDSGVVDKEEEGENEEEE